MRLMQMASAATNVIGVVIASASEAIQGRAVESWIASSLRSSQ
jgi:hypothetical protein